MSVFYFLYVYVFFFKQKTAYEMRISDWSSDVCSSDLFGSETRSILMALQDLWLEGIDVDAALYDVRDDDAQAWEVRALAGASIGIDPIAGLRAVIELSSALERIVRGESEGKTQLADRKSTRLNSSH